MANPMLRTRFCQQGYGNDAAADHRVGSQENLFRSLLGPFKRNVGISILEHRIQKELEAGILWGW